MRRAVAMLVLVACSSSPPSLDRASIGHLGFGIPDGWISRDVSSPQRAMFRWTPATTDNERKESLTVIRSDRPATANATADQLQQLLLEAQATMPDASFSRPVPFTTRRGFHGARIEGSFVPPGSSARYWRIHAVFVDHTALVNVLYTARELDRESFEAVLDSFFREEA